ncbi:MAG: transketolase family protein [Candidatus Taylorbacteria bacterium]|nr:transketolase family protein [Candidatus Taylorbacteria bacterium]
MHDPELKLNPKIFDSDVEVRSAREGFGEGLLEAAALDKRVVGLCGDLTESTHMTAFKQKFPDRFVEVGVAEQNLVTVASGMAAMGKIPFAASYAVFNPGRNWEQIRTTICYNNQPVKIIGSHVGVSVGPDGGSHQALEDIAITRVLPRMVVISPCDAIEARKATVAAARTNDPTYIRLTREKTPIMTTDETPFEIGKARIFFEPAVNESKKGQLDVAIIATGSLLHNALKVARMFELNGKSVAVMNISTIKPLDQDAVIRLAHRAGAIVTVEEHQIAGGMGSAVAECLAANLPVPIEFVGVRDQFGQSGTPAELIELYGMGVSHITEAVNRVIIRKKA